MKPLLSATIVVLALLAAPASAEIMATEGWRVHPTKHSYATLIERVDQAAADHKLAVVTRASATVGAKKALDKDLPGNMVVGLYHPRFAVPMLEASVQAGIEAPIRVYITENPDGTATLSYKTPTKVFSPYYKEGGEKLKTLAEELDRLFGAVAAQAAE
jgi:uncharacterized protein (DUF302 family)